MKYTVNELYNFLAMLIKEDYGEYKVKVSVNYDHCDHLQDLQGVWYDKSRDIEWIILDGGRDY